MPRCEACGQPLPRHRRRSRRRGGRPTNERLAAATWLTTYLSDEGPTQRAKIIAAAAAAGISLRTLMRAGSDMGVVHENHGCRGPVWSLPDDVMGMVA